MWGRHVADSVDGSKPPFNDGGKAGLLRLGLGFLSATFLVVALALLVMIARHAAQSNASFQPPVERAAQTRLPHSTDALWATLSATQVREDVAHGTLTATFPAAVERMAGKTLAVSGFMLPLDTGMTTQHFLLSKYTPVCPFCPPGAPNEVIEVTSASPIYKDDEMIGVTGRFSLERDGNAGLFYRLDGAEVVDAREIGAFRSL